MNTDLHLNPSSHLPPVECPLLVEADDGLLLVERTGYIEQRDRAMEYRLLERIDGHLVPTGKTFVGRCRWTYP